MRPVKSLLSHMQIFSTHIRYTYIKLCRYLIADPIFHYICYYTLHYMYTSQDELTTCTIHNTGVQTYSVAENLHANLLFTVTNSSC